MLSDRRHSYIHKYESNASMLSRVIFYLKSVHFLFLFSIYQAQLLSQNIIICLQDGEKFIEETMSRLTMQTDAASAVKNSDLVIEAIVENLDIKKQLFSVLDNAAPK